MSSSPAPHHPGAPFPEYGVKEEAPGSGERNREWSEEEDRIQAARAFVNAAADSLLRVSLGALCKPRVCVVCGITFLAMTDEDDLCHVDVGVVGA